MLQGSTLMLAALVTLMPPQLPPGTIIHEPAPMGQGVVVPSPFPPVIVPPEYHQYQAHTGPAPCGPGACGPVGFSCKNWNLAAKWEKLKHFLCYQSVYKMPCCQKCCEPYRPPLYEWFPPCVGGCSHPMPCLQYDHCPACKHPLSRLLGQPGGGCANCGAVPH